MESTTVGFRPKEKKSAKVFLRVNDAHAEAWVEGEITEGAIGIEVQCEITGERWEGLTKKLIVSDGVNGWPMMIKDGKSIIPHEVLREGVVLMLGVDGWDAEGNLRIPTILAGACYVSKSVAGLHPMVPLPPSPDIVAQILAAAEKALEIAADIERRADNHEFDGDDGYSPTVEIAETEDGYLLTVTDKDGDHTAEIRNGTNGVSPTVRFTPIEDGYQITITDAAGEHTAELHNGTDYQLTEEDKEEIAGMVPGYDDSEIWSEVGKKMVKHILEYDGTHIKEDGENLTFTALYEMLMEKPDFCVLVYNNYAYHPNGVSTSQIVFSSEYPVNGYDRAHRITMLANGTVTATETESEHTSSRVNAITEANEGSTVQYPSVKGVADYVKPIKQGLMQLQNTGDSPAPAGKVWTATEEGAGWTDPQGGGDFAKLASTLKNEATDHVITGENRADPTKFVADRRADSDTVVRAGETSTAWIPVTSRKLFVRYSVTTTIFTRVAVKNANDAITLVYNGNVSGNGMIIDLPEEALYVRSSSTTPNSLKGVMLAFSDTVLDFEEFYEREEHSRFPPGMVWGTTLTGAGWQAAENGSANPWYGKKMVVDGDSITHDQGSFNYWQFQAANLLGMTLDVSNRSEYASGWKGVGGSRIANDPVDSTNDPMYNIVLRYQLYADDADIVLIAGGTNDWAHGNIALGDFDSTDIHTFNGALNTLLPGLKEKYPAIPVVMMTPIKRGAYGAYGANTPQSHLQLTQEQFVDAMIAKCKQYNVHCLDMWSNCPINPNIDSMANLLYNRNIDLVHPNVEGHKVMGRTVAGFIRSIG